MFLAVALAPTTINRERDIATASRNYGVAEVARHREAVRVGKLIAQKLIEVRTVGITPCAHYLFHVAEPQKEAEGKMERARMKAQMDMISVMFQYTTY